MDVFAPQARFHRHLEDVHASAARVRERRAYASVYLRVGDDGPLVDGDRLPVLADVRLKPGKEGPQIKDSLQTDGAQSDGRVSLARVCARTDVWWLYLQGGLGFKVRVERRYSLLEGVVECCSRCLRSGR
jgi:hypothetical protein